VLKEKRLSKTQSRDRTEDMISRVYERRKIQEVQELGRA